MFDYSDCRGRLCFYILEFAACRLAVGTRPSTPKLLFSPLFQYPQFWPLLQNPQLTVYIH